jgi:hypothetical protein
LKALVPRGPDPEKDGLSAFRVLDICRICEERSGVTYSETGSLQVMKGSAFPQLHTFAAQQDVQAAAEPPPLLRQRLQPLANGGVGRCEPVDRAVEEPRGDKSLGRG